MSAPLDGWRLAVGTLTTVRVRPPEVVDRRTASWAVALAPLAVVPLGVAAGVVVWVAAWVGLPALAVGLLVVGVLALGTRGLHVDGLSDVADGLTASYDAERSLAAMKGGTSGPAGTVAMIVVLGLQAAGAAHVSLSTDPVSSGVAVGVLVCLSRWALLITCLPRAARQTGLGAPFAGCVRPWAAVLGSVVLVVATVALTQATFPDESTALTRGLVGGLVALVVPAVLTARAVRRLGGTTGDVHGAGIEVTLAVLLVSVASAGLPPAVSFLMMG